MKCKTYMLMMMLVAAGSYSFAQGLEVGPGTCIKVETGTTLKISAGDLLLNSDATGDATVIAFGSVTLGSGGKAIVERYLPGAVSAWHMVSPPVNAMAITASSWAPGTDEDLYLWHEPDPGIWVNYKNQSSGNSGDLPYFDVANGSNNFSVGRGYIVNYHTADVTKNFESSTLNTGNVNITLAKSAVKGWTWSAGLNLIGNPYPSGLDWSAVTKANIVTEVWAQVYNTNKAGGAGYEPVNGPIASGQGFFVQAVSDGAVLALKPSQQVHTSTQMMMKNGTDQLVLRLSNDTFFDETTILLHETSVSEHDFYDASKFFSFDPQVPQLYTLATDGWQLAVHSLEAITESTVIPLSIKMTGSGIMTVSLTKAEGAFEGQEIILQDMHTNIQHKLSDTPTYSFMASDEDDPNRFLLKFGAVAVDEIPAKAYLNVWVSYHLLYILNPDSPKATVELYSISGQVILRKEIGQGLQSIPVNVATGAYLVMMRTDNAVAMRKLFINHQ